MLKDSDNKTLQGADGVKTNFEFSFKVFKETDLIVQLINTTTDEATLQVLNTDYTVSISKIADGGSITFLKTAPASGYRVFIYRKIDLTQPSEIPTEGNFPELTIENAFDRACMISQQLQEQVDRTLKTPSFSDITEVNIEQPVNGNAIMWTIKDKIATLANSGLSISEMTSELQAYVNNCSAQVTLAQNQAQAAGQSAEIAQAATGQLPVAKNLTYWARLDDGLLHNMDLPDVLSPKKRFIVSNAVRQITIIAGTFIRLNVSSTDIRYFKNFSDLTINVEAYLDTGTALTNGKDYSIFLVPGDNSTVGIKISLNKTCPDGNGYTIDNTRRIGGFHTECVNVGTINGHALSGWLAGDIIPLSVWTLWHKPNESCSPSGMRYVPQFHAWKDIYFPSGTGANTVSQYGGTITRSRDYWGHEYDLAMAGKRMISSVELTATAQGCEPLKAILGKAEASILTAGGHLNETNRRIISNGGDEDDVGCLWSWLDGGVGPTGGSGWVQAGSFASNSANQYGTCYALLGGGAWDSSGYAGPSSRNGCASALAADSGISARGWAVPYMDAA